jgi:hypothetical protein
MQMDAQAGPEAAEADVEALLAQPLEPHPELEVGSLPNGLRYVILPNRSPPDRFEAHLEVHAGERQACAALHSVRSAAAAGSSASCAARAAARP